MTTILHLSDNNILIQKNDSVAKSQGYVWLKQLLYFDLDVEHNPVNHCRIEPQKVNNHYWQQCSQTAISKNPSGMRHAADLIWQHITRLKQAHDLDQVILVVPSHYHQQNLQLLLGIFKACDIEVLSLVNKAIVGLSSQIQSSANYLHVDVQLHQTACSEVIAENGKISLGKVQVIQEAGLQAIQDNLLKMIQAQFIKVDRFDPLHYAETEQQLFDQLPRMVNRFQQEAKVNVAVTHNAQQYSITVEKSQWVTVVNKSLEPLFKSNLFETVKQSYFDMNGFEAILEFMQGHSSLNGKLPSYSSALRNYQNETGTVIYQTEQMIASLSESEVVEQIELAESVSKVQDKVQNNNDVTHLLLQGVAVNLSQASIAFNNGKLSFEQNQAANLNSLLADGKVFVIGEPQRKQLRVGDRLGSEMADGVITAIRVEG